MATPHVAGVAALMLAEYPALTPAEFDILLAAGSLTEDLSITTPTTLGDGATVRNDSFGYGLIDAEKAVTAAKDLAAGGALPPFLSFSPSILDFGSSSTTLPLTLSNAGGGTLTVTGFSDNATWLSVDNTGVPAGGLGTYTVTVDRTGLADAIHSATINFTTINVTTGVPSSSTVTVLMQVGSGGVPDAGLQTIYLLNSSGALLQSLSVAVNPLDGTYPYSFADVAAGSYLIKAGTDLDHDNQLCDAGEACGAYPLRTDPALINVTTGNLTGIDFNTGF